MTPEIIRQINKVCNTIFKLNAEQLAYLLSEIEIYDERIEQMRDSIEVKGLYDGKQVWHIGRYIVDSYQSKRFYELFKQLNLKAI